MAVALLLAAAAVAASPPPPPAMCKGPVLPRSDWLGADILPADQPLHTGSAAECCAACTNHTTSGTAPCLFWSRFTSAQQQGRCYLKTHATNWHSNALMESGSLPGAPLPKPPGPPRPHPPGPHPPPAPPQSFGVDLSAPLRPFVKPFLGCVGSSHMAMGLRTGDAAAGPGTAAGKGQQARVGALWREHLKLTRDELNMSMFRGHGLFDDDVGIFAGVGKPINTAPLDSLFGFTASIGIRPVVEMSYCPKALAGSCGSTTDAYKGFICAPNLNSSFAELVPLSPAVRQRLRHETGAQSGGGSSTAGSNSRAAATELERAYSYARGNAEYARMVQETVAHLVKRFGVEEVRQWKFEGARTGHTC
jgi:hypothetical protein